MFLCVDFMKNVYFLLWVLVCLDCIESCKFEVLWWWYVFYFEFWFIVVFFCKVGWYSGIERVIGWVLDYEFGRYVWGLLFVGIWDFVCILV